MSGVIEYLILGEKCYYESDYRLLLSDGYWYKFTKKNVTKENATMRITEVCGFGMESIIAFGDDFADIGMLDICGLGVAMGNTIDEVKNKADIAIGSNNENGIAAFIEENLLI